MDDAQRLSIITAAVSAAGPQTAYTKVEQVQAKNDDGSPKFDSENRPVLVPVEVQDPGAWQTAVIQNAVQIAVMAGEKSNVVAAIDQITKSKTFTGTVIEVKKEPSSTRGIITLHTGTDRVKEGVPAGCEQVRTDRTDNPLGLALARKMKNLIGHKVVVWVEVEEINGGSGKVRVLRHVESLGVDQDFARKAA